MRASIILSFVICFLGCNTQDHKSASRSCSDLFIDKRSKASNDFVEFRDQVKYAGFLLPAGDTSLYPFTKRLFFPPRLTYLRDTLQIDDCSIFDSVNIHYFELLSEKPSIAADYPDIRLEEEQFKDKISCDIYRRALASLLKKQNLITKPTILLQSQNRLYIFQASDTKHLDELKKISKLLDPISDDMDSNF
jgi:hypothetical protein